MIIMSNELFMRDNSLYNIFFFTLVKRPFKLVEIRGRLTT